MLEARPEGPELEQAPAPLQVLLKEKFAGGAQEAAEGVAGPEGVVGDEGDCTAVIHKKTAELIVDEPPEGRWSAVDKLVPITHKLTAHADAVTRERQRASRTVAMKAGNVPSATRGSQRLAETV